MDERELKIEYDHLQNPEDLDVSIEDDIVLTPADENDESFWVLWDFMKLNKLSITFIHFFNNNYTMNNNDYLNRKGELKITN